MRESLALVDKWLQTDLDEWTRHVIQRHFDPDTGSPYWLKRAGDLGFDPHDITRYAELSAFGPFSLDTLRTLDPVELIPQSVPRPVSGRVWESGGTTGDPCRVLYTPEMTLQRMAWRHWSFAREGFRTDANWIQATPTGPHLIGNGIPELSSYGGRVYPIDADPRWVKRLIRAGKLAEADEYTDHIVEQIALIMRSQHIDYLNITPVLLSALIRREPELAATLQGVRISGTHITPAMFRSFGKSLGGSIRGRSYGNTFGSSAGIPAEGDGEILPYLPNYPHVTLTVVDRQDWTRTVGFGEFGQVKLTAMHDDLFLPNILERDQAMRHDTGDAYPCDGVANVLPFQKNKKAPEGIY